MMEAVGTNRDLDEATTTPPSTLATVVTLGTTLVACIVGGLLLGLFGDHIFGTSPLLLLLGLLLGIVGAGFALKSTAERLGGGRG